MKNLLLNNKPLFPETSYLILRFFTGVMMCYYHGWSKLMADSSRWERLGNALTYWIGLDSLKVTFGFLAAFSESIGSLLIAIGLFTRPATFLLGITMTVASSKKISEAGIDGAELPLLFLILCLVIILKGPGKLSLDRFLFKNRIG
jgi:putative oxidoreductase